MLAELYKNKKTILKKAQEFFKNSNSLIPKIGCELEFFLLDENAQKVVDERPIAEFIFELEKKLTEEFSLFYEVEKEQGASQIEIKTIFTSDLSRLADELENAKKFIKSFAEEKKLIASFAAQPFVDDCGSALQFNISLHDENDENVFSDKKILENVACALLELTNSMMIFLAPKAEDYARFCVSTNRDLFKKGKFTAPVNLSFGADNRTCAIRIPVKKESAKIVHGKRLEYRVATADADSTLCIATILLAVSHGIKNQKSEFKQIFGNAFDEQYKIKNFCKSLEEAEESFFAEGNCVREFFEKNLDFPCDE